MPKTALFFGKKLVKSQQHWRRRKFNSWYIYCIKEPEF